MQSAPPFTHQETSSGMRPVGFYSRKLTPAEID
jgi:hypothetical protein